MHIKKKSCPVHMLCVVSFFSSLFLSPLLAYYLWSPHFSHIFADTRLNTSNEMHTDLVLWNDLLNISFFFLFFYCFFEHKSYFLLFSYFFFFTTDSLIKTSKKDNNNKKCNCLIFVNWALQWKPIQPKQLK